jgi:hypothetical protein
MRDQLVNQIFKQLRTRSANDGGGGCLGAGFFFFGSLSGSFLSTAADDTDDVDDFPPESPRLLEGLEASRGQCYDFVNIFLLKFCAKLWPKASFDKYGKVSNSVVQTATTFRSWKLLGSMLRLIMTRNMTMMTFDYKTLPIIDKGFDIRSYIHIRMIRRTEAHS